MYYAFFSVLFILYILFVYPADNKSSIHLIQHIGKHLTYN
jgi:hypothetical protein